MTEPLFQRTVENFHCEHCHAEVVGNGYTNHCPKCLYSKHVDINPGDRAAICGGLMTPIRIEGATGVGYTIVHMCEKCGYTHSNKVTEEDDMDAVITLAKRHAGV